MKNLKCNICESMGNEYEVTGNSNEEVMGKMKKHIKDTHPAENTEMMKMSSMEQEEMMKEQEEKIRDEE